MNPRNTIATRIKNWVYVQRIEKDGGVSGEWDFPNLLLNKGLDEHFRSALSGLGQYGCMGEGSATPAATDTALGGEAGRSNATGGINRVYSREADGHLRIVDTKQIASDGSYNITEVGFSHSSNPVDGVNMRSLVKDSGGNPVSITLDNTQALRIIWERNYLFSPIAATAGSVPVTDFPGYAASGAGKYSFAYQGEPSRTLTQLSHMMYGSDAGGQLGIQVSASDATPAWSRGLLSGSSTKFDDLDAFGFNLYTNGDYYREGWVRLKTTQFNQVLRAISEQTSSAFSSSANTMLYLFTFDEGEAPTKDDLGKVLIELPRITLARA